MKPQDVLRYYGNLLSDYERTEILEYPEVYFIGLPNAAKIKATMSSELNFGFDEENGDYKYMLSDHIGYRYEIVKFLGKGSFGTALQCVDHKTGKEIALKLIKNKQKYLQVAGVELKILEFLKKNDPEDIMNVVHLSKYFMFRRHLCICFELLSMNLYEFLKVNDFNVSLNRGNNSNLGL